MSDAGQIHAFCSALLGGPDGDGDDRLSGLRAYLWSIGTDDAKRTRWERADDLHAIVSAATSLADRQPHDIAHVYIGTGLVAADHPDTTKWSRRAKNSTVSGLFALCVDIDIASAVHESKPYPPDLESARLIWEAVPLRPSIIMHSGNGLQVWWLLAEPWVIEPDDDARSTREAMYTLARDWSSTLRYHAHRLGGWQIDSTFDLARVMRVPGTLNAKGDHVTSARVLEIDPTARYEVDEFREAMADPEVIRTYGASISGAASTLVVAELPGVDLAQVWARVTSTAYREADYTPAWLAMMLDLMPGSNLEAVWLGQKTMSGDSSPSGVDASLARLLINTGRVDDERLTEAIMCRRLRVGTKIEKVDPNRRTDYLVRTITRIRAAAANGGGKTDMRARIEEIRRLAAETPAVAEAVAPQDEERDIEDVALEDIAEGMPRRAIAQVTAEPPAVEPPAEPGPPERPVDNPPPRATSSRSSVREAPTSVWPDRHPSTVSAMQTLGELLLNESEREEGVEIFGLEYRDHGEHQRGRMVLRIPPTFSGWVAKPPPMYRPNRPFYCAWYKRDAFDVPRAYRNSLTRDALIRALDVGSNRDAWKLIIDELVPHWTQDSSGSDMVTQMHEWLVDFLRGHPATTHEQIAVENRRAFLVEHCNWGTTGTPVMLVNQSSFLDFIARQPGGVKGRDGRTLVGYLDVRTDRRPWMTGADGKRKRRSGWLEINPGELGREEWDEVLEIAQDALRGEETRRLRMVKS